MNIGFYKNKRMKQVLLLSFFLVISVSAWSQNPSCAQTLRLAQSIYDQGRLHELEGIITKGLEGSTDCDQQTKVSLHKLMTLAYIYLEEPEKADAEMLKLLNTDHYFEINEAVDPAEFVALYETFRTLPVFRIGIKSGTVASQPNAVSFNQISEGTGKYGYEFGFDIGAVGEIPVAKKFTFNPGIHYTIKSFSGSFDHKNSGDANVYASSIARETENWLAVPIAMQYNIFGREDSKNKPKKFITKFNPYLTAGISLDLLLNSSMKVEQKRAEEQSIESRTITLTPQREKFNASLFIGGGGKIRAAGGYLFGEIKFAYGLTELNSESTLLSNQETLFDYSYVDAIFKLNSLFINVGYVHNFFSPKKISPKK